MAGAIVGVVGEEAPLVIVDGAAEFEVNRVGWLPFGSGARGVGREAFFEASADNLGKAHLVFGGDALGLAVKVVGDLNLSLNHGYLPTWRFASIGQGRGEVRNCPVSAKAVTNAFRLGGS